MSPRPARAQAEVTPDPPDMREHAGRAAALLRSLANPNRLLVLCALGEGERTVGELNREVPLSQSALSQHLAVLRAEGLVATRREARHVFYRLQPGPVGGLIAVLQSHFCPANPDGGT